MKFEQNGSAASEEKYEFENVNGRTDGRKDGQTDDGREMITIAHPEHSSGELKTKQQQKNTTKTNNNNMLASVLGNVTYETTRESKGELYSAWPQC